MTVEITQVAPDGWENRVFTNAQPRAVFDYLADFERHVEWERELLTVRPLNRRVGTLGREYLKTYGSRPTGLLGRIFARGQRVTCRLRELERPERIVWQQYRSHQASTPFGFQELELVITPRDLGSLIVLTRRFSGIEGIGADVVARFSSRWGMALQGLPPEVRAAAGGSTRDRPGLFSSPDEVVRRLLDGHPSRGPGPTSLERLTALLDSGVRDTLNP